MSNGPKLGQEQPAYQPDREEVSTAAIKKNVAVVVLAHSLTDEGAIRSARKEILDSVVINPTIIDGSGTEHIATSMFGAFIKAHKTQLATHGENHPLKVVIKDPVVQQTFALTKLDKLFEIYESMDAAYASLRAVKMPQRISTGEEVKAEKEKILDFVANAPTIIDASRNVFMHSEMLSALTEANRIQVQKYGSEHPLEIVINPDSEDWYRVTKLDRLFKIYRSFNDLIDGRSINSHN